MTALIVNYCGIGDGLIELPFLKCIEQAAPDIQYFLTNGLFFKDDPLLLMAGLLHSNGVVPEDWRKFMQSSWNDILRFANAHDIQLVINLRIVGESYEDCYLMFKSRYQDRFAFWDLDQGLGGNSSIRDRFAALLKTNLATSEPPNHHVIANLVSELPEKTSNRIGVNIHSGSRFKLWPPHKWKILCLELIANGYSITVYDGYSESEKQSANLLVNEIAERFQSRIELYRYDNFVPALRHLAGIECLVTTDSWMLHAATALKTDTVGLHIVTSPVVWGGVAGYSWPVESRHLRSCENFDTHLGICRNGYAECRLVQNGNDGIDVADVLGRIEEARGSRLNRADNLDERWKVQGA